MAALAEVAKQRGNVSWDCLGPELSCVHGTAAPSGQSGAHLELIHLFLMCSLVGIYDMMSCRETGHNKTSKMKTFVAQSSRSQ
jgi:hypothetical protein